MGRNGSRTRAGQAQAAGHIRRSLVIPMYHEQERIAATLRLLAGSGLDRKDTEFVLVDDGSDDGTVEVANVVSSQLGLQAHVLAEPHRGKGAAVAQGVLASNGASVVFTDADLSAGIVDVEACFETIEEGQADVVAGTRAHAESDVAPRGSRVRRLSGWGYNWLLRVLGLTTMRDTQCGLKGFTSDAALLLFSDLRTEGLAFDIEVLARAQRAGLRVLELPVSWTHMPGSRVRVARDSVRMTVDSLRIRRIVHALPAEDIIELTPDTVPEVIDPPLAAAPQTVED